MASCLRVTRSGTLKIDSSVTLKDCTGYVVLDSVEYQTYVSQQTFYDTPDTTALAVTFSFAFTLPLLIFLVSWAYQSVINFAIFDHH